MSFRLFCLLLLVGVTLAEPDSHEFDENLDNSMEDLEENEYDDEGGEFYQPEEEEEIIDPCGDVLCEAGKECLIDSDGKGYCDCVEDCYNEEDDRRKVCSNFNETWPTDCSLHRMRCLCEQDRITCPKKALQHMHIDYYGVCQRVLECPDDEMMDFPRRMREWLFNIMRDMADREILNEVELELQKEAENDDTRRWTNAAIWKWCALDNHPSDRSVSRHELFPLRAPLYALEHCIAPFLNKCDGNDDHLVSLKEWTSCLELSSESEEDMEKLCDAIRAA